MFWDAMMVVRDGIEPPTKALQTFPFSFCVPRHFAEAIQFYSGPPNPSSETMKEARGESRLVSEHT